MSDISFKSPGVVTREIDLSSPTAVVPSGVPAAVVGTARRGPAFVPVTVATFQDFVSVFGNTDGEKFGPLAMNEWLRNAKAGTYVRVLGSGDCKARTTSGNNTGKVTNAGFIVGDKLPQSDGNLGINTNAGLGGSLGRTFILSAFMSESNGSKLFSEAGIGTNLQNKNNASPIIRALLMFPSGVLPGLSSSAASVSNNTPSTVASNVYGASNNGGEMLGSLSNTSDPTLNPQFVLLLNGHKNSDVSQNILTCSFDPTQPNYLSNILNTDPTKIEQMGHYLYSHFAIDTRLAVVTGTGNNQNIYNGVVLLQSGNTTRNSGSAGNSTNFGVPNFEGFEERYQTAFSPFIISQKFGGKNKNLFRVWALDDGKAGSETVKITLENIRATGNENNQYGSFDLLVRKLDDSDDNPVVLERWTRLSLNPSSDNYVARVIGNTHTYYDFDKNNGAQKLVIEGTYSNKSQYIRVETNPDLDNDGIEASALPVGFRGLYHLVTSGTSDNTSYLSVLGGANTAQTDAMKSVVQPPVPFRKNLSKGVSPKLSVDSNLTWGVQFELKDSLTEPNSNTMFDTSLLGFTKYYPKYHTVYQNPWVGDNESTPDKVGTILDADRFNNNIFSLERVEVITDSSGDPDSQQWACATYRRNGVKLGLTDVDGNTASSTRLIDISNDFAHIPSQKYLKFTLPLQGGFDGLNIFDKQKANMSDVAIRREMNDSNQGLDNGPTVAAFKKAISILEEKSDVDIQLLTIPGIRHEVVTNFAIQSTERRFDALYIMDIEEKDTYNSYLTSSDTQIINVKNTADRISNRALNSSFAACYFPDVVITDPSTNSNVRCPPSVAVLGAFALNDTLAYPWFAPAGFTRGALSSVLESQVKLSKNNLDTLYSAAINPLTSQAHTAGVVVYGQKTLLATESSLERINVRRLLIDIRRKVKNVANTLLFEPNRVETLGRFSRLVTPILSQVQQLGGIDRYKVQIDTSTTTQADIENNTIRGKIYIQPTKSIEFISLDFNITNSGQMQ